MHQSLHYLVADAPWNDEEMLADVRPGNYVERLIGSIRREYLDHVIICNETSLRRIRTAYFSYYHATRPHLSLAKDSPEPREWIAIFGRRQ